MVERPAPLHGNVSEQIQQIYDYLCRLADHLNSIDITNEILNNECGTGVPLQEQFKAIKNILGGS